MLATYPIHIPPLPTHATPTQEKRRGRKGEGEGIGSAEAPGSTPGIPHGPGLFYTIYIWGNRHADLPKTAHYVNHNQP